MTTVNFYHLNIKNHDISIWDDKFILLKHPEKCDICEDDFCREHILKYLDNEGIINIEKGGLIVIDSYIE